MIKTFIRVRAMLFFLISLVLPNILRVYLLSFLFQTKVPRNCIVSPCYLEVRYLRLHSAARVGFLTVVRNLHCLCLQSGARIGSFNWIFGSGFYDLDGFGSRLILDEGASITSRHLLDCMGGVTLGRFSLVAGFGTQILTHSIDLSECRQKIAPVEIGEFSFIGTRCILLKGAVFPNRAVLSAGSVFSGTGEQGLIYYGLPAKPSEKEIHDWKFFHRSSSHVA